MTRKEGKKDISVYNLIAAIVFWGLTISWIVFIFYLSSETGTESSYRSASVLSFIEQLFGEQIVTDYILRKLTHVFQYALLTGLVFLSVRYTNRISESRSYAESPVKIVKSDNEMYIAISLWLSMLVAVIDEYHQLFVDGRDGTITDVGIDLVGILFVLIIARIIFSVYLRKLGKKEVRYE